MADYLVSALVQTLTENLDSATLRKIGLLRGVDKDLISLEATLTTIQSVLEDAEIQQRRSEPIQIWLRKLKDVAYDIEDLLDEMAFQSQHRSTNVGCCGTSVPWARLAFKNRMAPKVECVKEKLRAIAEQRKDFHLTAGAVEHRFGAITESRQTGSWVIESEIYGRREEKEKIITKLIDEGRNEDDLSVYAVWGMGGLGKTTLAQLVYNDKRVEEHFNLRMWVCVSDDFSIQRLGRAIIESIDEKPCNIFELDILQRHLRSRLMGKKFLLVLDDVWNEDSQQWDRLTQILRCVSNGSMLLVTTRSEKVVRVMAPINVLHIELLNEEDSWSLFKRRAFLGKEVEENLVAIGKAIVKKCRGVPLAIKALGGLMLSKCGESEWLAIKESEIWHLSDDENGILASLRLSYDNMRQDMRQCFAYCCLFPKDRELERDQLIQLWMANGFISSNDSQGDLYLAGQLIFKELVWRSFLQDIKITYKGETVCKMHDLMHDLAASVMRYETCILEPQKKWKLPKTIRHLFVGQAPRKWVLDYKSESEQPADGSLRSIIFDVAKYSSKKIDTSSFIAKQHHLRVLGPYDCGHIVPDLIPRLKHLRYLVLLCNQLKNLPECLTHLYNLQTLKLMKSGQILELPCNLRLMKNLWFLEMDNSDSLRSTPPGLGELSFLHRLSIFIVDEDVPHQIGQLKELNLGGKLTIRGLSNVRNLKDAESANLIRKRNITSLRLLWEEKDHEEKPREHFDEVLQGLKPHRNIEEIRIEWYSGSKFPDWMSNSAFKNLKKFELSGCDSCEQLPRLGSLPSLRCLVLRGMNSIKIFGAEWYGDGECSFPALAELKIMQMPNLEDWRIPDSSVRNFPCLTELHIHHCPKLIRVPLLPSLTHLRIIGSNSALITAISIHTSLKSLSFDSDVDIVLPGDFVQRNFTLESLKPWGRGIRSVSNMLDNLCALKTLDFSFCSVESLPDDLSSLRSLDTLVFFNCDSLVTFPATLLGDLPSLRILRFSWCQKLVPLSGPLERASGLCCLEIDCLLAFQYLPESMRQLSALRELKISGCAGLCSLPDWIGSLNSLERLKIAGCPQLEKRCRKGDGEDWPKISHILHVAINRESIQSLK